MSSTNVHCGRYTAWPSSLFGVRCWCAAESSLQILVVSIVTVVVVLVSAHSARSGVLLIEVLEDGLRDVVKLLLLLLVVIAVGVWIVIEPIDDIVGRLEQRVLVLIAEPPAQLLLVLQLV